MRFNRSHKDAFARSTLDEYGLRNSYFVSGSHDLRVTSARSMSDDIEYKPRRFAEAPIRRKIALATTLPPVNVVIERK